MAATAAKLEYSRDPLFEIRNGTSMSTPLVAGCVAVVREVLGKYSIQEPSAALIINGAVPLSGLSINAQGFGRVNLNNSVAKTETKNTDGAHKAHTGIRMGQPLKQDEKARFHHDSATSSQANRSPAARLSNRRSISHPRSTIFTTLKSRKEWHHIQDHARLH